MPIAGRDHSLAACPLTFINLPLAGLCRPNYLNNLLTVHCNRPSLGGVHSLITLRLRLGQSADAYLTRSAITGVGTGIHTAGSLPCRACV